MIADSPESHAQSLLSELVALPSVNPVYGGSGEGAVAAFVAEWIARLGVEPRLQEVEPGRSNVIARIGPDVGGALLLEAHMDTVGVEGWAEGSPFRLSEREGRLYGRGACDTKGSLACFLLTLAHFVREPDRLKRPLVFAATVDEENEQLGAMALAELLSELGVSEAITGEPTRSRIVYRHKGVARYKVHVGGKAAHGSTPELGENAIYAAARLAQGIAALAQRLHEVKATHPMERGSLNLGVIRGGNGFNVVPDACELDLDRRLGVQETPADAADQLRELLRGHEAARLEIVLERPPLVGGDSEPMVETLLEAAAEAGVGSGRIDAPYMTNAVAYEAAGVPAVVFGPGDIAQAHKVDEYIENGEIERSLRLLSAFLKR